MIFAYCETFCDQKISKYELIQRLSQLSRVPWFWTYIWSSNSPRSYPGDEWWQLPLEPKPKTAETPKNLTTVTTRNTGCCFIEGGILLLRHSGGLLLRRMVCFYSDRLSNLTSGLLNLYGSVILAFPLNVRFFSTGPFVVYFDEDGADQTFE